jgi:hypothetical protein
VGVELSDTDLKLRVCTGTHSRTCSWLISVGHEIQSNDGLYANYLPSIAYVLLRCLLARTEDEACGLSSKMCITHGGTHLPWPMNSTVNMIQVGLHQCSPRRRYCLIGTFLLYRCSRNTLLMHEHQRNIASCHNNLLKYPHRSCTQLAT